MKYSIVIVLVLVTVNAAPQHLLFHPTVYQTLAVPAYAAVSQHHSQDALGQYSYGYSDGNSAKNEVKTLDGITRGSYSYIDANSQLQTVNYVSDALGFRVAATNLPHAPVDTNVAPVDLNAPPQPVEDTVEVKQARAEHLAAVAQAQQESSDSDSDTVELEAPEPVEDTEEVKQAREEHLQAVEDAKSRSSEASPIVVAQHAHQLIQAPVAHHILHPIHLTHSPVTLVRAAPASFAYSVYAPGSHLVVA